MKSTEKFLTLLFGLLLVADCFLIKENLNDYRVFTKILLIPTLLVYIFISTKETKHKRTKALVNIAFMFCFLGDLSLLDEASSTYFVLGLCAFLLAHIFFTILFYRLKPFSDKYRLYLFMLLIIVYGYVGSLLFLIWSGVKRQGYEVPVAIYAFFLGAMLLTAINSVNNKSIKRLSKNYFIPGAILFVVSDSILALIKFAIDFQYGEIVVMITYALAIYLIAMGTIRFLKK